MSSSSYSLADFARDVDSRFKLTEPETFWLCEELLQRILANGVLGRWINEQLRSVVADSEHLGDWSATEAVLRRGKGWTLSLATFDAQLRFIHALPFLAFYAPLDVPLTGERYRLPSTFRNDVFDPAVKLEPAGTVKAGRNELLRLETTQYAYDFQVPRQLPILRFASASLRPLEWLFSKSTLQAWQANDADMSSTQLRVASFVLGKIAHHSSVGPLKQLSSHPHHAVRWAAIQNLGRLSRSEAMVKIREAVHDPHPHVSRAAQKTLDQLDKRTPR